MEIQNKTGFLKLLYHYAKRSAYILKEYGLKRFIARASDKLKYHCYANRTYQDWIRKNEPGSMDLSIQRLWKYSYAPKISIIVPTLNTEIKYFIEMLESVKAQSYANWELCIADGGSKDKEFIRLLRDSAEEDKRIKIAFLNENNGIARNSNAAISLAIGDYVAFLDHDDTLAPFALFELVKAINENPDADMLYSDEDILSDDGARRMEPQFKPDWSPDLLRSFNYICHLTALSKQLLDTIGPFRAGFEGSQDHDLFLRATEHSSRIVHIPKILYHWRQHASSSAMNATIKMFAYDAGKKAIGEHLSRSGLKGTVEDGLFLGAYKIGYHLENNPIVSIIIPNHNNVNDLRKCITSIKDKTTYQNYEIVIVENNSTLDEVSRYYDTLNKMPGVQVIEWKQPFNYSSVNNYGADHATGDVLLFLNNDTEVINPSWLHEMLGNALRRDVGAVGAKLYYPNDTIQHAGIIIGLGGITGHSHRYYPRDAHGYMGRLQVVQNYSAVTGGCLMTRRDVFMEVNGFDESYPLAFSDIDFCFHIREKGYLVVWTPYAELYHDESNTRGYEDTPDKKSRFRKELELYRTKWVHVINKSDPYYNVNLTHEKEDFSLKI